jgi:DNA replication protein DnaC
MLRLPTIRDRFTEIAAAAEREQMTYLGFLSELVIAECDDRTRRRAERRIRAAGFPRPKRLEEFSFEANPAINPAVIGQLATCAWVKAGHPLCLIGDSGTGKSHLLIALGTLAAEAGYRVRYTLASRLVNELVEAADDKQLSKLISRYGRLMRFSLMSWGTFSWTGAAPSCCSKFSPNGKSARPSLLPPTSHSLPGQRHSPTRDCALRLLTG